MAAQEMRKQRVANIEQRAEADATTALQQMHTENMGRPIKPASSLGFPLHKSPPGFDAVLEVRLDQAKIDLSIHSNEEEYLYRKRFRQILDYGFPRQTH
jgi:hypothetical protein